MVASIIIGAGRWGGESREKEGKLDVEAKRVIATFGRPKRGGFSSFPNRGKKKGRGKSLDRSRGKGGGTILDMSQHRKKKGPSLSPPTEEKKKKREGITALGRRWHFPSSRGSQYLATKRVRCGLHARGKKGISRKIEKKKPRNPIMPLRALKERGV